MWIMRHSRLLLVLHAYREGDVGDVVFVHGDKAWFQILSGTGGQGGVILAFMQHVAHVCCR